jgi:hypothetical protein
MDGLYRQCTTFSSTACGLPLLLLLLLLLLLPMPRYHTQLELVDAWRFRNCEN